MSEEHPHARTMIEYGNDLLKDRKAHLKWQQRLSDDESKYQWEPCLKEITFDGGMEYRRTPLFINSIEVPQPEREPLKDGQTYYIPYFDSSEPAFIECHWDDDDYDKENLRRGIVHLVKSHATTHTFALLMHTETV